MHRFAMLTRDYHLDANRNDNQYAPVTHRTEFVNEDKALVGNRYLKERYLGKGGFAHCVQVDDKIDNQKYAMKIIQKVVNGKQRAMDKIESEIAIHADMDHPSIVKMYRYFEDDENVYMILELCDNKSIIDLLKVRQRLTEDEVRSYISQLVEGIKHIHSINVIHRDLKLGNLFLTAKMELKIGDFGLSERVLYEGDMKKSMSGTPNYIAPEILLSKEGHSYEVDIWAIGVIMYTMLVGKPPFQSKNSKATCNKIKKNQYSFPENIYLSRESKNLISSLLRTNPKERLSLDEILKHEYFAYPYPKFCAVSTLYHAPQEVAHTRQSREAFITTPYKVRELKRPRSNIKNYLMSSTLIKENIDTVQNYGQDSDCINLDNSCGKINQMMINIKGMKPMFISDKIPDSKPSLQKTSILPTNNFKRAEIACKYDENEDDKGSENCRIKLNFVCNNYKLQPAKDTDTPRSSMSEASQSDASKSDNEVQAPHAFQETMKSNICEISVARWIDYSHKYGIAYQLSNGCLGVLFNDDTKIVNNPKYDKIHYFNALDMLIYDCDGFSEKSVHEFGTDLRKKIKILNYMKKILLSKDVSFSLTCNNNLAASDTVVIMKKWSKVGNKIIFKLNSKCMQIIRGDKSEILLKYDTGAATYYKSVNEVSSLILPENVKQLMFSSGVSLNKKIEAIESLFVKKETDYSHKNIIADCENRTPCTIPSTPENRNEKSTKGFTLDQNYDSTPRFRKSRYRTIKPLNSHQSTAITPFKNLNSDNNSKFTITGRISKECNSDFKFNRNLHSPECFPSTRRNIGRTPETTDNTFLSMRSNRAYYARHNPFAMSK